MDKTRNIEILYVNNYQNKIKPITITNLIGYQNCMKEKTYKIVYYNMQIFINSLSYSLYQFSVHVNKECTKKYIYIYNIIHKVLNDNKMYTDYIEFW